MGEQVVRFSGVDCGTKEIATVPAGWGENILYIIGYLFIKEMGQKDYFRHGKSH